jgi:iron complex outermembrane receptor protein
VYELRKDGIAIPDASGVTREQGDQRSRGVELELRAQLGPGWFTAATYAYTDAELTRFREPGVVDRTVGGTPVFGIVDRSGKRPPFAPRHTATLWTTRDLAGFEVAAGCRWVGAQHIAADNAFRLDGAFTVDATLSRRIADGRLRLHLKNLTDTDYETRGFGATSVVPADPISVHAVFDWWL